MIIDIVFVLVMLLAVYKGLTKGLVLGIFSMITVIIGLAASLKLSSVVANYIKESSGSFGKWLPVLSFIIVFIAVVLLVMLVARLIEKTIQLAMLGWLNRLGGFFLYVALYSVIFSVFLFYAGKTYLVSSESINQSVVYPFIAPLGTKVINHLGQVIPIFKDMFLQLEEFFDRIAAKGQ